MDYTFISENYVWIIVVAVILVMTIIGYIADKTNFGEKKDKKVKDSKKEVINEQPIEEEFSDMETLDESINYYDESVSDIKTDEVNVEEIQPELSQSESLEEAFQEESLVTGYSQPVSTEDNFANIEQPAEELSVEPVMPLDDFEMPTDNNIEETDNNLVNEYEQYKQDMVETSETSEEKVESVEPENFELPNIEQLNQEIAEVEEDEDVWKF